MRNTKHGFTLVELLVVIGIIAVLVTVAMASYSTAQRKTRDGRRKADIHAIQVAYEQLYAETGSYYSGSPASCQLPLSSSSTTFFSVAPADPKSGAYTPTCTDNQHYCICATLEADNGNAVLDCSNVSGKFQCARNQQ
jgi:prepilin-type N-terminal cleavage/methylation domain-containing protein